MSGNESSSDSEEFHQLQAKMEKIKRKKEEKEHRKEEEWRKAEEEERLQKAEAERKKQEAELEAERKRKEEKAEKEEALKMMRKNIQEKKVRDAERKKEKEREAKLREARASKDKETNSEERGESNAEEEAQASDKRKRMGAVACNSCLKKGIPCWWPEMTSKKQTSCSNCHAAKIKCIVGTQKNARSSKTVTSDNEEEAPLKKKAKSAKKAVNKPTSSEIIDLGHSNALDVIAESFKIIAEEQKKANDFLEYMAKMNFSMWQTQKDSLGALVNELYYFRASMGARRCESVERERRDHEEGDSPRNNAEGLGVHNEDAEEEEDAKGSVVNNNVGDSQTMAE
jgi:hypothetical protein